MKFFAVFAATLLAVPSLATPFSEQMEVDLPVEDLETDMALQYGVVDVPPNDPDLHMPLNFTELGLTGSIVKETPKSTTVAIGNQWDIKVNFNIYCYPPLGQHHSRWRDNVINSISLLSKRDQQCHVTAKKCERVACSYDSSIKYCALTKGDKSIRISTPCPTLGDMALLVGSRCLGNRKRTAGTAIVWLDKEKQLGYSVIVGWDKC